VTLPLSQLSYRWRLRRITRAEAVEPAATIGGASRLRLTYV